MCIHVCCICCLHLAPVAAGCADAAVGTIKGKTIVVYCYDELECSPQLETIKIWEQGGRQRSKILLLICVVDETSVWFCTPILHEKNNIMFI